MVKSEEYKAKRQLLAAVGVYLILLGIAFGIAGARYSPPAIILVIGNVARELVIGSIVVFCAYRCFLTRAAYISAIVGFLLLVLTATTASFTGQFGVWTALRVLGAILLVVLGVSFARRA